jgi:hypothetical protein
LTILYHIGQALSIGKRVKLKKTLEVLKMGLLVILNNRLGYIVRDDKEKELRHWLKNNGAPANRKIVSMLANKPLAPDITRDPGVRCPLTKTTTCEYLYFPRQ